MNNGRKGTKMWTLDLTTETAGCLDCSELSNGPDCMAELVRHANATGHEVYSKRTEHRTYESAKTCKHDWEYDPDGEYWECNVCDAHTMEDPTQ